MRNSFTKIVKRLPAALRYYPKVRDLNLALELAAIKEATEGRTCSDILNRYHLVSIHMSIIDKGSNRDVTLKRRYLQSLLKGEGMQELIRKSYSLSQLEPSESESFLYKRPLQAVWSDIYENLKVLMCVPFMLVLLIAIGIPVSLFLRKKFDMTRDASFRAMEYFGAAMFGQLTEGDKFTVTWIMYKDVEFTPKAWVNILRVVIHAIPYRNRTKAISDFRAGYRKWIEVNKGSYDPFKLQESK